MPVQLKRLNRLWRLVEPDGSIAMSDRGKPRDGGGHVTRAPAERQLAAMNRPNRMQR